MRATYIFIALGVILFMMLNTQSINSGEKAPDFRSTTLGGQTFTLSSLKGHVVIVDYWATWCGPCCAVNHILQSIHKRFSDQGVIVIGMNVQDDTSIDKLREFINDNHVSYPITLSDSNRLAASKYHVSGIPATFLIDQSGVVRWSQIGVSSDEEEVLTKQIQSLLEHK